jgi:hypothetical protein
MSMFITLTVPQKLEEIIYTCCVIVVVYSVCHSFISDTIFVILGTIS